MLTGTADAPRQGAGEGFHPLPPEGQTRSFAGFGAAPQGLEFFWDGCAAMPRSFDVFVAWFAAGGCRSRPGHLAGVMLVSVANHFYGEGEPTCSGEPRRGAPPAGRKDVKDFIS